MPMNPPTAADDRGYEVVWADEEGYETGEAVSEQLANGLHKVIGMGVRTCWAGDETAHRLAEALSRVARVTLMHSNPNYRGGSFEWTLCFDAPDHRVIEEYRELVETILKSAVDQLWPHRHNHDGYVPVDGLYFSEYREAEDVPLDWHVLFARHQQAQGGNQARLPRAKHRTHARPTPPPLPAEDGLILPTLES